MVIRVNNLRKLRNVNGLSQKAFATKISVAPNTVSQWESGTRDIDSERLQMLADFFSVSTDYILGRTNEPSPQNNTNIATVDKTSTEAAIEYFIAENDREPTQNELEIFLAINKGLFSVLPKPNIHNAKDKKTP